jgi:hypothetical protein
MSYIAGFAIVNYTEPNSPTLLANNNFGGTNVTSIWVQGPLLMCVDNLGGFGTGIYSFDISDFTAPILLDTVMQPSTFNDIYFDGDLAYLASDDHVYQFNISDPKGLSQWGYLTTDASGVWGFGAYVLSANNQHGIYLTNATDPQNLVFDGPFTDATAAIQLTINGDWCYIANTTSLVLAKFFRSVGDSFVAGDREAYSTEIDETEDIIENATLTVTEYCQGTSDIDYYLSADGGTHWESVLPGVKHSFAYSGNDLRFRATFKRSLVYQPYLYDLNINYEFNETVIPTTTPTPTTPTSTPTFGFSAVIVSISISVGLAIIVILRKSKK